MFVDKEGEGPRFLLLSLAELGKWQDCFDLSLEGNGTLVTPFELQILKIGVLQRHIVFVAIAVLLGFGLGLGRGLGL